MVNLKNTRKFKNRKKWIAGGVMTAATTLGLASTSVVSYAATNTNDDEKIVEENNNTVKTNVINTANVNNRFSSKNANALLNAKLQTAKNNPKSEAQLTPEDKTAQINMYSEPTAINTQTGNLEGHKELSQPLTGALSGRPISNNPEDGVKIDIYTKDGGKKVDKDGLKIPTIYKNDGNFPKDSNDGKIYYYDNDYTQNNDPRRYKALNYDKSKNKLSFNFWAGNDLNGRGINQGSIWQVYYYTKDNKLNKNGLDPLNKNSNEAILNWYDTDDGNYLGSTVLDDYSKGEDPNTKFEVYAPKGYLFDMYTHLVDGNGKLYSDKNYTDKDVGSYFDTIIKTPDSKMDEGKGIFDAHWASNSGFFNKSKKDDYNWPGSDYQKQKNTNLHMFRLVVKKNRKLVDNHYEALNPNYAQWSSEDENVWNVDNDKKYKAISGATSKDEKHVGIIFYDDTFYQDYKEGQSATKGIGKQPKYLSAPKLYFDKSEKADINGKYAQDAKLAPITVNKDGSYTYQDTNADNNQIPSEYIRKGSSFNITDYIPKNYQLNQKVIIKANSTDAYTLCEVHLKHAIDGTNDKWEVTDSKKHVLPRTGVRNIYADFYKDGRLIGSQLLKTQKSNYEVWADHDLVTNQYINIKTFSNESPEFEEYKLGSIEKDGYKYIPVHSTVNKLKVSLDNVVPTNGEAYLTEIHEKFNLDVSNQTVAVKFVDDQKSGEEVASQTKTGKTGQTIELSSPNDKYELVSPSSYTFKAENNAPIIVHLKHATKAESTSKSVVRDIIFKKPTGTVSRKQIVTVNGTKTIDKVTGDQVGSTNWQDAYFEGMDVPNVTGYVPSVSKIERANAKDVTTPLTVTVSYTAGNQTVAVKFVDDQKSGEEVGTTHNYAGETDKTISLNLTVPVNYVLADNDSLPQSYTFKAENNAPIIVHLKHATENVTNSDENAKKVITRTITVNNPDGQITDLSQHVILSRIATKDLVTNKVKYGQWNTGKFNSVSIPVVENYIALVNGEKVNTTELSEESVDINTLNQVVVITYVSDKSDVSHYNPEVSKDAIIGANTLIDKGSSAQQFISNFNSLPKGTTAIWTKVPDTIFDAELGEKKSTGIITINYPDKTTVKLPITVKISAPENSYVPSEPIFDDESVESPTSNSSDELMNQTERIISHNAYVYNKNGERVGDLKYLVGTKLGTSKNSIQIQQNGEMKQFYQIGDNEYVKVANFIATKKTLTHNAYIYESDGITRVNNKVLQSGKTIYVYESLTINGKKYYRVRDGYVKVANFEKKTSKKPINKGVAKKLRHNAFIYNSKGKRVSFKLLKKHNFLKVYETKTIHGKKYYRIGKNQYVKVANFE